MNNPEKDVLKKVPVSQLLWQSFVTMVKISVTLFFLFYISFHHIENEGIYPKETFSFANTFIDNFFIEKELERYNNASGMEKALIRNEYIFRMLMEKGKISNSAPEDYYD